MRNYKEQVFLNPDGHPSSSSVVTYNGNSPWAGKGRLTYIRVSDCHGTIQLHKTDFDTDADFCKKLEVLEDVISRFRLHLEAG